MDGFPSGALADGDAEADAGGGDVAGSGIGAGACLAGQLQPTFAGLPFL